MAPAGFDGDVVGERMNLFVPLSMQPHIVRGRHWRNNRNVSWLSLIARLKPGTSLAQAEANVNLVFQQALKGDYGAALSADDRNAIRDTHEIGVRMALGAVPFDVMRLVLRETLLLLGVGLAVGIPLSLASTRLLHSCLFGLKGTDPVSLITVVVLLGIVATVAGFIPARRAAGIDPMRALRYE